MNAKLMFSSEREDWETPQSFFDGLNREFHFTLDAAASPENAKCANYYTKEQDGLAQSWAGHTVWVNPPYGRYTTGLWVRKAYEEHQRTGCTVVMLLPARTDTIWFHDFVLGKAEIAFVRGRLKFSNCKFPAPFPSLVAIYGGKSDGN
nr:MAG TPA: DNA N-6-adenine-methyltransferase [Caudoviricetes sp.]